MKSASEISFTWATITGRFAPNDELNSSGKTSWRNGEASIKWILSCNEEPQAVTVAVPGIDFSVYKDFFETKTHVPRLSIVQIEGDNQEGEGGKVLPNPISFLIKDLDDKTLAPFVKLNRFEFVWELLVDESWVELPAEGKDIWNSSVNPVPGFQISKNWKIRDGEGQQKIRVTIKDKCGKDWKIAGNPVVFTTKGFDSYSLSVRNESYTELTGGRSINKGVVWFEPTFTVSLGFTFNFFGEPVDTFHFDPFIGTGLVSGHISSEADYNQPHNFLLPYWHNLADKNWPDGGTSNSPITYHVIGNAPSRIGVIQWKNAGFQETENSDFCTNFQLWLFETDGTLEIHYGPSIMQTNDKTADIKPGVVLLRDYAIIDGTREKFTDIYSIAGNPAKPTFVRMKEGSNGDISQLSENPESGTIFRITPQ